MILHYSYEIDVLVEHTADSPLIYPIKLTAGILTNAEFLFEVGDGYSTCILLWDDANQILPSNPDGFYCADGLLVSAPLWHNLSKSNNQLYVIAWNRGGVYDHSVNLMLSVKAPDEPDVTQLIDAQNGILDRLITTLKWWS